MSMIFSALREIEKSGEPAAPHTSAATLPVRRSSLAPWIAAGTALAGGAAAAAYLWLQPLNGGAEGVQQLTSAPVASQTAAAATLPAADLAGPTSQGESAAPFAPAESVVTAETAEPALPAEPAVAAAPAVPAPPVEAPAMRAPAAPLPDAEAPSETIAIAPPAVAPLRAETSVAASAAASEPPTVTAPALAPRRSAPAIRVTTSAPVDHGAQEARVAQQVKAFNAAMTSGQLETAAQTLAQLRRELRPESITLLRLSAWHAMATGQTEQARLLYGEILHRLPGDENAGINAAILAWDAGRHDTAREIIEQLRLHHPDSELIKRYRKTMQQGS